MNNKHTSVFPLTKSHLGIFGSRREKSEKASQSCSRSVIAIAWSYLSLKWEGVRKATFSSYEDWMTHILFRKGNA